MAASLPRRLVSAALFCGLSLGVTNVYAQAAETGDPLTRSAARDLAAQGAEAFDQQRYDAALDYFQRAGALVRAPTIELMRARSLRQLGRWVEAIDAYETAQRMPLPEDANPTFRDAMQNAGDEAKSLWEKLPRLNVRVEGSAGKQVEIWIDGRKLPEALAGVEAPFDPGPHHVEIRGQAGRSVTRDVTLSAGAHETLSIPFDEPSAPPTASVPAVGAVNQAHANDTSAPARRASVVRTMSWVAVGAGSALMATGVVAGVLALNKRSDLDAACQPGCPPAYSDDITRFRSYRTVSWLGISLGATALVAGAGYLLLSHKSDANQVSLWLSPGALTMKSSF